MIELLPEEGKFYKANLHSHSTISDGVQTPEQMKELYKSMGYHAICYTDHEVILPHKELCDENFVALHGYEVSVKQDLNAHTGCFMPVYHFNLIAKDPDNVTMARFYKTNPSWAGNSKAWAEKCGKYTDVIERSYYDIDWLNDYTKALKEAGYIVNYNHPEWSLHGAADYVGLKYIDSIELINGGCHVINDNTSLHYQNLLRAGRRVFPTAGDDNHGTDAVGMGWTMIKAPDLTYEALIHGLERGDCYVSEGPEILSLILEDGKIKVKTSPAFGIYLLSEGRCGVWEENREALLTEAEFDYTPELFGSFFRIEVRDAQGYKAFSNAYFTDEIAEKLKKA